jgi:hypothetical protein
MIETKSRSCEGWFQGRIPAGIRFGTTPALRATPPESGGEVASLDSNRPTTGSG